MVPKIMHIFPFALKSRVGWCIYCVWLLFNVPDHRILLIRVNPLCTCLNSHHFKCVMQLWPLNKWVGLQCTRIFCTYSHTWCKHVHTGDTFFHLSHHITRHKTYSGYVRHTRVTDSHFTTSPNWNCKCGLTGSQLQSEVQRSHLCSSACRN